MAGLRRLILGLAIGGHLDETTAHPGPSDDFTIGGEPSSAAFPVAVADPTDFRPLSSVAQLHKGLTSIKQAIPGPYPFVVTADARLSCDHYDFEGPAAVIPMVSSTGHGNASINRIHYQEGRFAVGSILCAVIPRDPSRVSARFLYEYLSAFKDELLVSRMVGSANVSLTLAKIGEVPIPLISAAAVKRLNELMALCDLLETAHVDREVVSDQLRGALLRSLVEFNNAKDGAIRLLQNLPRLVTKPAHVGGIRKATLNLAVRGKLVQQAPFDSPERIPTTDPIWRTRSVMVDESVNPGSLPAGWQWCALATLAHMENGDRSKNYPSKEHRVASGIPFVNAGHLNDDRISEANMDYISEDRFALLRSGTFKQGDILFCIRGSLGKVALVSNLDRGAIASSLIILRPHPSILPRFLHVFLKSDLAAAEMRKYNNGTAQPNLAAGDLGRFLVPLPSVEDQARIVARVDEVMAVCDEVEASLATEQTERSRLLGSLLRNVLNDRSSHQRSGLLAD